MKDSHALSLLRSLVGASVLARLTVRDLLRLRGVNRAYFEFVRAAMAARATPGFLRAPRGCAYLRLVYMCGRLGVPVGAWRVDLEVADTQRGVLRRFCGSGAQVTLLMPRNLGGNPGVCSSAVERVAVCCQGATGMVFPADGARGAWVVLSAVSAVSLHLTSLHVPSSSGAVALLGARVSLPLLTELNFHGCDLRNRDLVALSRFSSLATLKLSENRSLSGPAIVELLTALPSLTSLDLGGIPLTVDERMARALAGMPRLATLVFADGLRRFDPPGGVKFCTLTALDVVGSSSFLPPWALVAMPALRVLRMSSSDNLNALKALPPSQLEELQCHALEDFRDLDSRIKRMVGNVHPHPRDWPRAPKSSGKTELDHVLEIVVGRQRALRRLTLRGHGPELNPWRLIKYLPPGLTALDLSGSSVARHGESSLALDLEEIACALAVACPGLEELVVSDYR